MRRRFRLLPIIIFAAALTVTLKLASIWRGIDIAMPVSVAAETAGEKTAQEAKADGEKTAAPDKAAAAADGKDDKKDGRTGAGKSDGGRKFDPLDFTESELVILQKLGARRAELERRAREIEMRGNLLKATENRIDAKIAQLNVLKQTVDKLLKKHDAQREAKLKSLVKIYENMKPKDAARIFERLDMPILLNVIERMREAKTAPIMANMDPSKAKSVTTALAIRRELPKPKKN